MILRRNRRGRLSGSKKMKIKNFWDKIAPRYAKDEIKDVDSYEKKLKTTQAHFTRKMKVLEIGCGTGMTAVIHSPFVKHYHATDISSAMIEFSKNRAKEKNIGNISFGVCDISNLKVKDSSVDAILAMSLLHLLDDFSNDLGVIARKLKPGGLFISSTPCLGDNMKFLKFIIPILKIIGYAPPSKIHFFKKTELLAAIEAYKFSVIHEWQPSPTKACFIIARKD